MPVYLPVTTSSGLEGDAVAAELRKFLLYQEAVMTIKQDKPVFLVALMTRFLNPHFNFQEFLQLMRRFIDEQEAEFSVQIYPACVRHPAWHDRSADHAIARSLDRSKTTSR